MANPRTICTTLLILLLYSFFKQVTPDEEYCRSVPTTLGVVKYKEPSPTIPLRTLVFMKKIDAGPGEDITLYWSNIVAIWPNALVEINGSAIPNVTVVNKAMAEETKKSTELNVLMTRNNLLLSNTENEYYFRVDAAKKMYIFGGYNQVLLGCPHPFCLDPRFDAIVGDDTETLFFRGRHYWRNVFQSGSWTTPGKAMVIADKFETVDRPIAAAVKDIHGNYFFFDYYGRVHIYLRSIVDLLEAAVENFGKNLDGIWELGVQDALKADFGMRRTFDGYYTFNPVNATGFLQNETNFKKNTFPDAVLCTKGNNNGTLAVFIDKQVVLIDEVRMLTNVIIDALETNQALQLPKPFLIMKVQLPEVFPENQTRSPLMPLTDLHPALTASPQAAYSSLSKIYLYHGSHYQEADAKLLSVDEFMSFANETIEDKTDILDVLNCDEEQYKSSKPPGLVKYWDSYVQKLNAKVMEQGTSEEAPDQSPVLTPHSVQPEEEATVEPIRRQTRKDHEASFMPVMFVVVGATVVVSVVIGAVGTAFHLKKQKARRPPVGQKAVKRYK